MSSRDEAGNQRERLVGLVLNGGLPFEELEKSCIEASEHSDPSVRAIAATCIGHLARLYGRLDNSVLEALGCLLNDRTLVNVDTRRTVADFADTAMDDVRMFVRGCGAP